MPWIAGIISAAAAAYSAYQQNQAMNAYPDTAASSKALSDAQAQMLPDQRRLQAAAQLGTTTIRPGYQSMDAGEARALIEANLKQAKGTKAGTTAGDVLVPGLGEQLGIFGGGDNRIGQLKKLLKQLPKEGQVYFKLDKTGEVGFVPKLASYEDAVADFTGYGTADVAGAVADATARGQLALAQKYDSQFIQSALEQEKLADPEAFAAREKMAQLVQDQIDRPQNSPVSDLMDQQVRDALAAANDGRLTDLDRSRLDAAVADAARSRGGVSGQTDFEQPLTTGFAGEQRQADAAAKAAAWLASGSSPEDIAYRREQQNLANLSALVNGVTPQSQFASLSGAQSGPTPTARAAALPTMPDNGNAGASSAISNWNSQQAFNSQQVSPWLAGVSAMLSAANAYTKAQGAN